MSWNECFVRATGYYRKSELERLKIFSLGGCTKTLRSSTNVVSSSPSKQKLDDVSNAHKENQNDDATDDRKDFCDEDEFVVAYETET